MLLMDRLLQLCRACRVVRAFGAKAVPTLRMPTAPHTITDGTPCVSTVRGERTYPTDPSLHLGRPTRMYMSTQMRSRR